ncbi:serine hydrolase [Reichenbachiella sp. MALMAid0571]|uniref:serine hydrolase domain-containing protein n=1 Tax=Reichenbachiella sp. MALMAid0571 TaxID=3143939 RepID=UPI0032DE857F
MNGKAIITIFIVLISTLTYGQQAYQYSQPTQLQDGWETGSLQSLEVDSTLIYALFNKLQIEEHKVHSVLLVKHGKIIIEEYFGGNSVEVSHDLRSVTKSIISILMGIAIDKGFVGSVDDPISKYIEKPGPNKNLDDRKKSITIKHLLTMSTGLDCNDWDKKSKGQEDKIYKKDDWLQYFMDLPLVNEPGAVSNYCTMCAVMTAEIISRTSGMTIDEFAKQYLFIPLGITTVNWGHTSNKVVMPSGKRLYMTARDMAKIGQLLLNNGTWNEEQIVPDEWLRQSTTSRTKITGMDYGYLWWIIPFKVNDKTIKAYAATGNGGQYIMVFPESDMVAVFTGGAYNSQDDKLPFAIVKDIFFPTFLGEK